MNRCSQAGRRRGVAWSSLIVAVTIGTTGCAAGAGPTRPSTPYKGDAVWNISSAKVPTRVMAGDG